MDRIYKYTNFFVGWLAFLIASITYCLTIEPTASFWDCPEFTTTGYKLEVGHPPGAPFFMLTANLFTQFTSDITQVAKMVNYMSALMSGACILFLFWSITHLVKKLVAPQRDKMTTGALVTIMGSGLVGALAYTFSDTFWFSAVESEVYAYSSLFTAVVFWLILKWEDAANQPHSDRWLILIAYLIGLSIGVHLLNLLCIPAIVLVYYYKKNPDANLKGSLLALVGSMVLVAAVLYGIVPGVVKVGGWFELLFVNNLGFSFDTGLIFYLILLSGVIIWGVYESNRALHKKRMYISFLLTLTLLGVPFYGYGTSSIIIGIIILCLLSFYLFSKTIHPKYRISARTLNTSLLCIMMIMVGYSSYTVIVIRSAANTPMDQNSPEDIFTLGEYMGREQYGSRPLFYGQTYASKVQLKVEGGYCVPVSSQGAPVYQRKEKASADEKDSYEVIRHRTEYKYAQNMLFPRMYSESHTQYYENWLDIKGRYVTYDQCGEMISLKIPTMWENLKFFFTYQVNFMYWRYFMWNFAGRQNDIQGDGSFEHGNWITGFKWIDTLLVGNQDFIPTDLKENKGRNVFYCLPLLLGIIGFFWQANRGKTGIQDFWVVFFLFFMTGLAIVLYLNQTPVQPRERDYAYAGSFYAFAIWIGMGVAGISQLFRKRLAEVPAAALASGLCLLVPIQMASQTWDDHDRSGRYMCRDFGQNYLSSSEIGSNPIIFTSADNDTFPLWYNQEVEEFRTDAKVCNLSYLQTGWYIDQMNRPYYDAPALPISWKRIQYMSPEWDFIPIKPELSQHIDTFYRNNPEAAKKEFGENPYELTNILRYWILSDKKEMRVIPTDSMVIKLDKTGIMNSGIKIPDEFKENFPEYMTLSFKDKRYLTKNELIVLDVINESNWERPVYMVINASPDLYMCFERNFSQEGMLYRITPFNTWDTKMRMDTEITYDCLMNRFKWGGTEQKGLYLNEDIRKMYSSYRRMFISLAKNLIEKDQLDRAKEVLERCEEVIPAHYLSYDYMNGSLDLIKCYYLLNEEEKAKIVLTNMADKSVEYLEWYLHMPSHKFNRAKEECMYHFYLLNEEVNLFEKYFPAFEHSYRELFNRLYLKYQRYSDGFIK